MRSHPALIVALVLSASTLGDSLYGKSAIPRQHHAWARFEPGAWTRVRIITESLDPQGNVTQVSTKETKTTLISKEAENYTLRIEVTVEVAGRRFSPDPTVVKRGFLGETSGELVTVTKERDSMIEINNEQIPSELRKIEIKGEMSKRYSTIHYSTSVFPYILKNHTRTVSVGEEEQLITETESEVIAIDMPWKVQTNIHRSAHIRTVRRTNKTTRISLDVHCHDIPGGLVSQIWKEIEDGKQVRRCTVELMDYGSEGVGATVRPARRRLFHRTRSR